MSVSGTIGGSNESAAYTYDNLGRLVTSNQTSNGSSAQRRFAYDRWGNRTEVWDATSGGNQIQTITLQGSGGIPTNQIASVTAGSTVNYTYDATGNVTNDGVHSYGYDSENRMVNVDGGSTASYAYDHQNRRYKKTVGSTVTHYVWQGSQVLAEHHGGTGSVLTDYIYSGSRMIAKVVSGSAQYFLSDGLSTRLVLDSSGSVSGRQGHLPFGEDFGESGTQQKQHLTSYERDAESGVDYALSRANSSNVGRFLQADPYRASGYIIEPQSWNRYVYVGNDPVNAIDPIGLFKKKKRAYIPEIDGPSTSGEPPSSERSSSDPTTVVLGDRNELETDEVGTPFDFVLLTKEQQEALREFINNLSKKCKDKMAALDSTISVLGKMSEAVGEMNIFDTNTIKEFKAIDIMQQQVIEIVKAQAAAGDSDTLKFGRMTIGQFFTPGFVPEKYGGTPAILTVSPTLGGGKNVAGIYAQGGLASSYFQGDKLNLNLTHELLHYVTGQSDNELQANLKTGGQDVSTWIKQGCPP